MVIRNKHFLMGSIPMWHNILWHVLFIIANIRIVPKTICFNFRYKSFTNNKNIPDPKRLPPTRDAPMLHFKVSNVYKIYMEPELKFYSVEQNLFDIITLTYYVYFTESDLSKDGMEKYLNSWSCLRRTCWAWIAKKKWWSYWNQMDNVKCRARFIARIHGM